MKALITYFSVGGTTKHVAEMAAKELGMDVYDIQPLHPYTAADVRYTNPLARCNKEKFGKKDVPVSGKVEDFNGKKVYAFATSGGSGIGKTAERLQPYVKGGEVAGAKLVHSASELTEWVKSL